MQTPGQTSGLQKSVSEQVSNEMDMKMLREIREERRNEEKNPHMRKPGSEVEIQQMAMRFVPDHNARPQRHDPINLFEHTKNPSASRAASQAPTKGVDFVHILEPTFSMKTVDSLATVPSTVMKRFSNDSVRGSALSTRLSDMPSMYSQALLTEEPSTALMSASTQEFDISPQSVSEYREKWLTSYMSGYTPKQTITVSIINMITRRQVELRVCKENTLNEVCHMYMQYEDHPGKK